MILLTHDDVVAALSPEVALDALRAALDEQAAGQVQMPPRQTTDAGDSTGGLDKHTGSNWLRISSAFLNRSGVMGFKAMNRAAGIGMRYLLGIYDIGTGTMVALMDANQITTARTAATSAWGTHLLADPSARTVGVLGSGVQARALVETYASMRQLDEVVVYSPTPANRDRFATEVAEQLGLRVRAVDDAEAAADASTVLVALRATREPVFRSGWLRPGMHITGLSSVRYDAREIDDETWRRADVVVVDDRVNVGHSGDARSVAVSGTFNLRDAHELWELQAGKVSRTGSDEVTLFKSSGNAMQDVALAHAVCAIARAGGRGTDLGEFPAVKQYD